MWILPLVGYLGSIVGFCFLTLAIASGLYYLSELVEEHTVIAKKVLSRLIYGIIVLQLLLCLVDRFPFLPTLLGIFSHVIYLGNMRRFPFVKLSDPLFVASCGKHCPCWKNEILRMLTPFVRAPHLALVLINHYVWFKHFSHHQERAYQNMSSYYDAPSDMPTFTEIASYFGICVWLVPFALFVSLSASDNVLPTMGHEGTMSAGGVDADTKKRRNQGMAKALVDGVLNTIGEISAMSNFKRNDRDRL